MARQMPNNGKLRAVNAMHSFTGSRTLTSQEHSIDVLTFGGNANHWKSVITECAPDRKVASSPSRKDLPHNLDGVECLVGFRFPDRLFDQLPNLKWIQNLSVGVDALMANSKILPHVRITNTKHLYGDAVSEYVIWAMLTLMRQFHTVMKNQGKRRWKQVAGTGLTGKTVGIIGLGDIGCRVAHHAAALHMQTIGFVGERKASLTYDAVDVVRPVSQLPDCVGDVDVLVLCLPLTSSSARLINGNIVARMKKSAIVINISRAGLIDRSVVVDAVASGRIAGAAIDVFDREPLRWWSSLWKTKNLLITPHTAALTSDFKTRVADLICENVVRFADGRPLLNEVDRSRGY